MKKILALVLTICSLLAFGCGSNTPAADKNAASKSSVPKLTALNLTYVKSPLNIPSIIEKRRNVFEEAFKADGITVKYSDLNAGPKQTQAMAAGQIDVCHALGGTSAILAAANGVDLKIVGIYSRAPKAFNIIAKNPAIRSVKDLKGKTVAGPKGTILHQLLIAALKREGMTINDVKFVSMGIPETAAALTGGSADAGLLAGPAALKITNEGAHILATGQGLLDATIVIAMRSDFIKNYPEQAAKFLDTHRKVISDYKRDPKGFYGDAAAETGLTIQQVDLMEKWYDFDPSISDSDIKDLDATQRFLIQTGMLEESKKIDINSIISKPETWQEKK